MSSENNNVNSIVKKYYICSQMNVGSASSSISNGTAE